MTDYSSTGVISRVPNRELRMSLGDILSAFRDTNAKVNEIDRMISDLNRQKSKQARAVQREIDLMLIALMRTVGIDLTRHDPQKVLGALVEVCERLDGEVHTRRLMNSGAALLDRFAEILNQLKSGSDPFKTSGKEGILIVDPGVSDPTDVIVVLQKNPIGEAGINDEMAGQSTGDRVDAVANRFGLRRYTHISSRNPVCVLVGEVRPIDIADFVERHDGVIVHNRSNGRFKGPSVTDMAKSSDDPVAGDDENVVADTHQHGDSEASCDGFEPIDDSDPFDDGAYQSAELATMGQDAEADLGGKTHRKTNLASAIDPSVSVPDPGKDQKIERKQGHPGIVDQHATTWTERRTARLVADYDETGDENFTIDDDDPHA